VPAAPFLRDAGAPASAAAARVLIVDDSAVARAVLARAVEARGRLSVAGSVSGAAAAMAFLARERVDLIVLDVQMPGVDGLTALPDLLAAGEGARVLVVSSECAEGATTVVQALALGAADTLVKPAPGQRSRPFEDDLADKLERLLAGEPVPAPARRPGGFAPAGASASTIRLDDAPDAWDAVAIGASTGGIHALSHLLRALPAEMDVPILITQHLPASFTPYFAAQIALLAGRPCDVAVDRLRLRRGRVVVAPGDAHVRCVRLADGGGAVRLSREPARSGCLPSVDPMLASVAECFGRRALGIVLSGMGRDGELGARAMAAAGACVVAQDQASSVVWGMPGAVAAAGVASALLPPDAIGRLLASGRRPLGSAAATATGQAA